MNIKPLFDKVVVESVNVEEKTKSGFFLPSSAQEKPQTCIVVAVGPGGKRDRDAGEGRRQGALLQVRGLGFQGGRQGIYHHQTERYSRRCRRLISGIKTIRIF